MNTQPEALRLADELTKPLALRRQFLPEAAAAELRRLHTINGELLEALQHIVEECDVEFCEEDWVRFRAAIAKATGGAA